MTEVGLQGGDDDAGSDPLGVCSFLRDAVGIDMETAGGQASLQPLVDAFGRWMTTSGFAKKTVQHRKGALKAVLGRMPCFPYSSLSELASSEAFADAVQSVPSWQSEEAKALRRLLRMMSEDVAELRTERTFYFTEVNPGIGAFGFAAEAAGGNGFGSELVSPMARDAYRAFHGSDSIFPSGDGVSIVLANLPFSMFVSGDNPDPEVAEAVKAACHHASTTRGILFRIDWTAADRMGISPGGYQQMIAAHLPPDFELRSILVRNEHFVPMEGCELFVAAASQWNGAFRLVAVCPDRVDANELVDTEGRATPITRFAGLEGGRLFPVGIAGRIDGDYLHDPRAAVVETPSGLRPLFPVEIQSLFGIHRNFRLPADSEAAYRLLGDSVVVPVAERAIRSFLRSLGLE